MPAVPGASWGKRQGKLYCLPLWNLHSGSKKSKCLVTPCSKCIGGEDRASVLGKMKQNEQRKCPNQAVSTLDRKGFRKGQGNAEQDSGMFAF